VFFIAFGLVCVHLRGFCGRLARPFGRGLKLTPLLRQKPIAVVMSATCQKRKFLRHVAAPSAEIFGHPAGEKSPVQRPWMSPEPDGIVP
jgi:hypothetical protein